MDCLDGEHCRIVLVQQVLQNNTFATQSCYRKQTVNVWINLTAEEARLLSRCCNDAQGNYRKTQSWERFEQAYKNFQENPELKDELFTAKDRSRRLARKLGWSTTEKGGGEFKDSNAHWSCSLWWSDREQDNLHDRILTEKMFKYKHRDVYLRHLELSAQRSFAQHMEKRMSGKKVGKGPPEPRDVVHDAKLKWAKHLNEVEIFPLGNYCDTIRPLPHLARGDIIHEDTEDVQGFITNADLLKVRIFLRPFRQPNCTLMGLIQPFGPKDCIRQHPYVRLFVSAYYHTHSPAAQLWLPNIPSARSDMLPN